MSIHSFARSKMKAKKAKGFSRTELKESGLSIQEALRLGIPIDKRRSSRHEENIQTLKTYIEKAKPEPPKKEEKTARTSETTKRRIEDIEGIGPTYAKKLTDIGIETTNDLLEAGSTPKGREDLATKTGISQTMILEWVDLADLFRINGIGEEYSDLLEEAGVDTVVELSRRVPENLHTKIVGVNQEKKIVRRAPSLREIQEWVEQAKKLPRKIQY